MNTLNHRGCSATIDYDDDRAVFIARLSGAPGARAIRAGDLASLRRAFEREVDLLIATDALTTDWRGQAVVHIDSAVHAQCALAAVAAGESLPLWIERTLRSAAERRLLAEGSSPPRTRVAPPSSTKAQG